MELIQKTLPDNVNIFLFGDTHFGSLLCHYSGVRKLVHMMTSGYGSLPERCNYGIHMGDVIEGILIDDPRFRPETAQEPYPLKQIDMATTMFEPVKHKLITVLKGNHEDRLWRFGNINKVICERFSVPQGGFSCKVTLRRRKNKKQMLKLYLTHGKKLINSAADDVIRRESNMILTLKRHLKQKAGDCILMAKGHTHKLLISEPKKQLYMVDDGKMLKQRYTTAPQIAGYIPPDHRFYVNTGAFHKTTAVGVEGYAELAEYDPIELGFAVLRVRDAELVGVDKVVV